MQININDTGVPHGINEIARQLVDPRTVNPTDSIMMKFVGEFFYLTGLVLLAAWRKALPAGVQVSVNDHACSVATQYFLTNTGFREVIETGHETPSSYRRIGRVPLRR